MQVATATLEWKQLNHALCLAEGHEWMPTMLPGQFAADEACKLSPQWKIRGSGGQTCQRCQGDPVSIGNDEDILHLIREHHISVTFNAAENLWSASIVTDFHRFNNKAVRLEVAVARCLITKVLGAFVEIPDVIMNLDL